MKGTAKHIINIYTEEYTKFVVDGLIQVKGGSRSEVANFMMKDWIDRHKKELDDLGLGLKDYRAWVDKRGRIY